MRFIRVPDRIRQWLARLLAPALLLTMGLLTIDLGDHTEAARFSARHDARWVDRAMNRGDANAADLERLVERHSRLIVEMEDGVRGYSLEFAAGLLAYVLVARETWRFRIAIAATLIFACGFVSTLYPLY